MTEANLFQPIDTIPIYGDSIGKIVLYDASHANESEEQRIHTVTTLASLAYGNEEAKNPEALYKRMQSIKHESLWEFIVDTYPANGIANSMRNIPLDYDERYSRKQNIIEHKQNIACFRIKVPLFVRAQFMRHRSFSYLEMSRRYTKDAKVPFEFWFPQDMPVQVTERMANIYLGEYQGVAQAGYHTQIASRFLPQTTYTEFYCMMETEGAKNYFKLRCDEHAQKEIRDLSFSMLQLLYKYQPEFYKKVVPNDEIDKSIRKT